MSAIKLEVNGDTEKLMKQYGFTDVLFLYNLNTFLEDDVLHYVLE